MIINIKSLTFWIFKKSAKCMPQNEIIWHMFEPGFHKGIYIGIRLFGIEISVSQYMPKGLGYYVGDYEYIVKALEFYKKYLDQIKKQKFNKTVNK
jgi:hypothetical protein